MSTVLSIAVLTQFYGLKIADDHKEKLVDGLMTAKPEIGPFLPDVPSLVFCLHLLRTDMNHDKILEAVEGLSMVYLSAIGQRIDTLSCSNLLSGWAEVNMQNEEMFEMLAKLVIEKDGEDAFVDNGSGTALVNIVRAMARLGLQNEEFLQVIMKGQI